MKKIRSKISITKLIKLKKHEAIYYQKKHQMEKIISKISASFIKYADIDEVINDALRELGKFYGFSYVCIYNIKNDYINISNEWYAEDVAPFKACFEFEIDNEIFIKQFEKGAIVNNANYKKYINKSFIRKILEIKRISNFSAKPLFVNNNLMAFLSFESIESNNKVQEIEDCFVNKISEIIESALARKKRDEKIYNIERIYQTIFETTNCPTVLLAEDGTIFMANNAWKKKFKEQNNKNTYGKWTDFVFKEDLSFVEEQRNKRLDNPLLAMKEYYFRAIDKNDCIRNIKLSVDMIPETKITVCSFLDLTELIQNQQYLEETLRFNNNLLIFSANPIFVVNADKSIKYVNPAFEELTGFSLKELREKKPPYPWWLQNTLLQKSEEFEKVMKDGMKGQEFCFRKKNGDYFWVEINMNVIKENGKLKNTISNWVDITERKKVEKALIESEKKYKDIFEKSPVGLLKVDKCGKILEVNDYVVKMLDLSEKKQVLKINIIKNSKLQEAGISQLVQKIINMKSTLTGELEFRMCCRKLWLQYKFDPIFDDCGRLTQGIFAIHDISDLKKTKELVKEKKRLLEKTLEYDKLKTDFFSNISHEFRTPLNVILATIKLLEINMNKDMKTKHKIVPKRLKVLKQNCYRLLRLINNLIDITKIDSGFIKMNFQNCNIVNLVEEVALSVADFIKNNKISLLIDTDVEEVILACDPEMIERIMLNLLSNAVKYTEAGGNILVYMQIKDSKFSISVKDTGIGIKKEDEKYIFERFRQVDNLLTRKREGSGIGLSLVKALVEMHNGKIFLNSKYDKGSEFIIEIPIKKMENSYKELKVENNITERIHVEFSDIYVF